SWVDSGAHSCGAWRPGSGSNHETWPCSSSRRPWTACSPSSPAARTPGIEKPHPPDLRLGVNRYPATPVRGLSGVDAGHGIGIEREPKPGGAGRYARRGPASRGQVGWDDVIGAPVDQTDRHLVTQRARHENNVLRIGREVRYQDSLAPVMTEGQ